jgi:catechol 2,3-dioxygenase-like lactoylglutathione lyase family enzyme
MSVVARTVPIMTIPAVLSLVTLGVRDVAAATRFYESLGFDLSSASVPGEVSFFRTAGGLLGLYGVDALALDAQVPSAAHDGFRGVTLAINVASRADVDSAIGTAAAAGAHVTKAPVSTDWGGYHGYFADPNGHLWEVAHNPFWPLGPDGVPLLP